MESESIVGFLENKTILITGATGFLGKMLVEKVLRIQPNVKKLYLLIRASDTESASHRMNTEIIGKELFMVLKEKWDTNFDSFISEKVNTFSGDVSFENLGVKDDQLRQMLWNEIDIIVNSAGTTSFDGRYDVALGTNTLGVVHVLGFAKKCIKLQLLVHVSTAYVCGEREGMIPEDTVYYTGKTTTKTTSKLDFKVEMELMAEKLKELGAQNASQATITTIMRDMGTQRAKLYGWPNTYVFTKAMGEICLKLHKDINMPLVIIRPAIVTSSYKEPFPGWIEGYRTVDAVIGAYGKGKVGFFLGGSMSILDLVPGDMVINLIIAAMAVHANQSCSNIIYHIGSSLRNPINISSIVNFMFQYFNKNPLTNKNGKLVKVPKDVFLVKNMTILKMYMTIRFKLPQKILRLYFPDVYTENNRKLAQMMRMINHYKSYVLFKGIFDDGNSKRLQQTLKIKNSKEILEVFNFDRECIEWKDYMVNTHIPGLVKYVMK